MPIKILLAGKEYQLDQATENIMQILKEADALQKINQNKPFQITTIDSKTWKQILELCKISNNNFPAVGKIKTSNLKEVIPNNNELVEALNKKNPDEINKLHLAAQYLKIQNLKRCIAATLACQIYIKPTLEDYNKKNQELKIFNSITAEESKKLKDNYAFMNN